MNKQSGFFISLEGGEGSGKTTQINALREALPDAVFTREPGGTPEAEKIRALLVQREGGNWSPQAECMLLFAARAMHVRDLIHPALEEGKIVITDRFSDSTRAYQGYGYALDLKWIESLNHLVLGAFKPDLTFILDLSAETGLERVGKRFADDNSGTSEDRFERMGLAFHQRMRDGYLSIALSDERRCHILDAARPAAEITANMLSIIRAAHAR